MPNVNDVIEGLERCQVAGCDECKQPDKSGYPWDCEAFDRMVNESIALLKGQEPVAPIIDETGVFYCANCKKQPVGYKNIARDIFRHNLYCPKCGKKVKWE